MNVQFKDLASFARENKKGIFFAFGFALAIALSWYGFLIYKAFCEERAHKEFAQALLYVDAPVGKSALKNFNLDMLDKTFQTEQEKWEKVAQVFKTGYENHSGTNLAPFFLVYAADAYTKLGKQDLALSAMEMAYGKLSAFKGGVKGLYAIKLAQMRLESQDQDIRNKGIAILKELILDEKNPVQDFALYVLGEYYWNTKDFVDVKNYWGQLMLKYGPEAAHPSPWSQAAHERLALITGN